MLIELDLEGVRLEMPTNTPILMLRESGGRRRMLPIYIGGPESLKEDDVLKEENYIMNQTAPLEKHGR